MKTKYSTPNSELLEMQLMDRLLQDSLVGGYGGEDAIPGDGTW